MKPSVYLETTIVSYLVGRLSRSPLVAANQQLTRKWWQERRNEFELRASAAVVEEIADGDPEMARERLQFLTGVYLLPSSDEVQALKLELLSRTIIPLKAETDALHIAIASVNRVNYLLSWNCRHIANPFVLPMVYDVCRRAGYEPPLVCTPYEFYGGAT